MATTSREWGLYRHRQKIGTVNDALVDEEGHFRYFIVDFRLLDFRQVLLPVGRSRIDYNSDRVYAVGMTRDQADNLPEFSEDLALDYDYEESVRVYRTGYWCFGLVLQLTMWHLWIHQHPGCISTPGCSLFGFYDRRYGKSATSTSGTSRSADYLQPRHLHIQARAVSVRCKNDHQTQTVPRTPSWTNNASKQGSSGWQACWNRNDSGFSPDWKERVVIERVTQQMLGGQPSAREARRNLTKADIHKKPLCEEVAKLCGRTGDGWSSRNASSWRMLIAVTQLWILWAVTKDRIYKFLTRGGGGRWLRAIHESRVRSLKDVVLIKKSTAERLRLCLHF